MMTMMYTMPKEDFTEPEWMRAERYEYCEQAYQKQDKAHLSNIRVLFHNLLNR